MRPGKKQIHFRINEKEYEKLKPKFKEFGGMGNYFMLTSREYSNEDGKKKIENRKMLADFYKKFNADLAHIGANFNQRLKHCNELALIGKMNKNELDEQIVIIEEMKTMLMNMQEDLYDITRTITKL